MNCQLAGVAVLSGVHHLDHSILMIAVMIVVKEAIMPETANVLANGHRVEVVAVDHDPVAVLRAEVVPSQQVDLPVGVAVLVEAALELEANLDLVEGSRSERS